MKAKEAITSTSEPKPQSAAGAKRKGSVEKAPEYKKGKKSNPEPKGENKEEVDRKANEPSREAGMATKEESTGRIESVIGI